MHILLVTTYFEPDQGATAVLLSRLAKQLCQRGHAVTVLTTLPNYPQGQILERYRRAWEVIYERPNYRVIQTWLWATPSSRISRKLLSQLSFMLTAGLRGLTLSRPDVILIEAQPVFTNFAGVFLSRWFGVPYVLNISDLWPDHLLSVGALTEEHPVYRTARALVDATYRGASGIIAASPAWAQAIERYIGPNDKTEVIYYGVDLRRFHPNQTAAGFRRKHGLDDRLMVSFLGTFATQYDFEMMLEVARRFTAREDVQFVFIGQGSQAEMVQTALTSGQYPNVHWLKWVDHAEMPLAWATSDVTFWALRSNNLYRGTIPAKLYEAMACGTPIVAATEDVAASLITESGGGLAVPFSDTDGMAAAIARLLDDPGLRKQVGQAGRAYAERYFDAEQIAGAYEQVLKRVVANA